MQPSQTAQIQVAADVVDFGVGHPDPQLLPLDLIRRAAEEALTAGDPQLLQYGNDQGDPLLREVLAAFLSGSYGAPVDGDSLFVSSGISQALDLVSTVCSKPGDAVLVEDPTYFLALDIFADHGLQVIRVPTDEYGMDMDALEKLLRTVKPAFVYTIPAFQNPAGVTLPRERREKLARLSREFDCLVVADEVYQLLDYGVRPPAPLGAYAGEGKILSLGSFSKILAPGLRLGWIQGAPELLAPLIGAGVVTSGGGLNPFASAVVWRLLAGEGLREHLGYLKSVYASRAAALADALTEHLPGEARFRRADGGFFIWLELPGVDTDELLPLARRHKVGFQPGSKFSDERTARRHLRLCFTYYPEERLEEGVRRLARAIEEV